MDLYHIALTAREIRLLEELLQTYINAVKADDSFAKKPGHRRGTGEEWDLLLKLQSTGHVLI